MSLSNLLNRCWRLYAAGEYSGLIGECGEFDVSAASSTEREEYHYVLALSYWRLEKVRSAASQFRRMLKINPLSVSAHLHLANTLDEMERFDEATTCYEKAAKLAPDSAAVLTDWAIMLYRAGQVELALDKFDEAERHCADDAYFHLYRGLTLEAVGELEEAAEDLKEYIERGHREAFVLSRLGILTLEMGQNERAEALLREAVEMEPKTAEFRYHLALCLKRMDEMDEAEDLVFRLLETEPQNEEYWALLGDLELERGNYDTAVDHYQKSLEINSEASHTLSGLAWVSFHRENAEVAKRLCLRALKADPGNCSALDLLRQLEPETQRLCRYIAEIHGETAEGSRFLKSIDCLASNPEEAMDYIQKIQQLWKEETWWEVAEFEFVEAVHEDHPGVLWISDYSFSS